MPVWWKRSLGAPMLFFLFFLGEGSRGGSGSALFVWLVFVLMFLSGLVFCEKQKRRNNQH